MERDEDMFAILLRTVASTKNDAELKILLLSLSEACQVEVS
jgi:hypothetical protein